MVSSSVLVFVFVFVGEGEICSVVGMMNGFSSFSAKGRLGDIVES